ncbi:hypothetical protein, partial [Piscirickettsia salmonis]|uniref:hypothetical protein n=1 Tax=Piscirickettsia salmonis TaxID=1238 RepID=UPI003EBBC993
VKRYIIVLHMFLLEIYADKILKATKSNQSPRKKDVWLITTLMKSIFPFDLAFITIFIVSLI